MSDLYNTVISCVEESEKFINKQNMSRINDICAVANTFITEVNGIEEYKVRVKDNNLEIYILMIYLSDSDARDAFIDLVGMSDSIYFINLEGGEMLQMTFCFYDIVENK